MADRATSISPRRPAPPRRGRGLSSPALPYQLRPRASAGLVGQAANSGSGPSGLRFCSVPPPSLPPASVCPPRAFPIVGTQQIASVLAGARSPESDSQRRYTRSLPVGLLNIIARLFFMFPFYAAESVWQQVRASPGPSGTGQSHHRGTQKRIVGARTRGNSKVHDCSWFAEKTLFPKLAHSRPINSPDAP